jgi:hypothetical protein
MRVDATKEDNEMDFWTRVKNDVGKGFADGLSALKVKAEHLTEEGKRKYRIFELKGKARSLMGELGAAVYRLKDAGSNPLTDPDVAALVTRVSRLEEEIKALEANEPPDDEKAEGGPDEGGDKQPPA